MKVAITGGNGLLGSHMSLFLKYCTDVETVAVSRQAWSSIEQLSSELDGSDIVFHCAAKIIGNDKDVIDENASITNHLISAIETLDKKPRIVFSSSINADRDDAYGQSKREADEAFRQWASRVGHNYTCLVLPHIFGEGGKTNHNSVVSTFCNDVAQNKTPRITRDGEIYPLHVQRAVEQIWSSISQSDNSTEQVQLSGVPMLVSELADKLNGFHHCYKDGIIPDLKSEIDLDLFNTYRSYRSSEENRFSPFVNTDDRGRLIEIIKEKNGGQVFFSVTKPGITRGQHFHRFKMERFVVISGEAEIGLRKVGSDEVKLIPVSGENPVCVDIPTMHVHNITNIGDTELFTMFWTHEFFDPEMPDTYPEDV